MLARRNSTDARPAGVARRVVTHPTPEELMSHRKILAAVAAAGAIAAPVAASAHQTARPAAAQKTIVGVAAGDPQFSTLVKLVKSAGLAKTLSGGSYTVFAPT